MTSQTSFSETAQQNMSYNIQISSNQNEQSEKQNLKSKKKVFEVFHKKEIIYLNQDSISNSEETKYSSILYKCIYCGNSYNVINRFETHMKMHVSNIYINNPKYFYLIDRRKTLQMSLM